MQLARAYDNTDQASRYAGFVKSAPDALQTLILSVEGVHCANCIQKIESTLNARDGVAARLNFSTRRLTITWHGAPESADALVSAVTGLGYRATPFSPAALARETTDELRSLLLCLGVAGFAMGNIMLLSFGLWLTSGGGMGENTRALLHWVSALIAFPAVVFAGRPFFASALGALKAGQTNMDVPISLALILTLGVSLSETMRHGHHVFFDSAVMLMFFLLIGRYLDARARRAARTAAGDLLALLSGTAMVVDKGGKVSHVPIRDLKTGQTVRVAAGQNIPVDGVIVDGRTEIDTSLVTGETLPRDAGPGDKVYAGTVNIGAPLTITVAKAAEDSLLSDIVRLMEKAEQGQAKYVRLSARAARLYTPLVHTLAALTFTAWWGAHLLGYGGLEWQPALMVAVTVLIITCPCALGLAVPVVQVLATGRLMKAGVLVKSGDALERLATIDTIIWDKTGTLTLGKPALCDAQAHDPALFTMAMAMAAHSNHPLSRALCAAAPLLHSVALGASPAPLTTHVIEVPGQGIEGVVNGKTLRLGRRDWCAGGDTADFAARPECLELCLAVDGKLSDVYYFTDTLKIDAVQTLRDFAARGMTQIILSGDRPAAVAALADGLRAETGLDATRLRAEGGLKPAEKYHMLEMLKASGRTIAMIGDGLNDAPSLAGADIALSPSTAIDMAQNAADIVFMGDRIGAAISAYDTAVRSNILVKQNFALAAIYNVLAVPMAMAGYVTPMIAAICMSGSSLLVIGNAFRLKVRGAQTKD